MRKTIAILLPLAAAIVSIAYYVHGAGASADRSSPFMPKPRGNFSLEKARGFRNFPLYFAGESVRGLPLVAIHRIDAAPYPGEEVRQDDVTFLYGLCRATRERTCSPPIQVQVWNACERYQALYPFAPDESLVVRGVPAAFYENWERLELYTQDATIVLFGNAKAELLDVATMLRGLNRSVAASDHLPEPAAGAREGRLSCQRP